MTISNTTISTTKTGDGTTFKFPIADGAAGIFFGEASEIYVQLRNGDTLTPQTQGVHFTISGSNTDAGTVEFVSAPASGVKVDIWRRTPRTQPVSLPSGNAFSMAAIEGGLDRITRMVQEIESGGSGSGSSGFDDNDALTKTPSGETWDGEGLRASGFDDPVDASDLVTKAYADIITDLASASAATAAAAAASASSAASTATSAQNAAVAAYDDFDDRYLGAKASDPVVDNDGDVLATGALYFNTASAAMKVYNGAAWESAVQSLDPRGAWVTTTAYVLNDLVTVNGSAYVCTVDHTSSTDTTPGTGADWETVWDLFVAAGLTTYATRTSLKAIDTGAIKAAYLSEAGREGWFVWTAGNFSASVTADTQEGLFIKANAVASSAGAWVRIFDYGSIKPEWFGAAVGAATDSAVGVQAAIDLLTAITRGGTLVFGSGQYYFSSTVLINYPGISIRGSSFVSTVFYGNHSNGPVVTNRSGYSTIENIDFLAVPARFSGSRTDLAGRPNVGLYLRAVQMIIRNIRVIGQPHTGIVFGAGSAFNILERFTTTGNKGNGLQFDPGALFGDTNEQFGFAKCVSGVIYNNDGHAVVIGRNSGSFITGLRVEIDNMDISGNGANTLSEMFGPHCIWIRGIGCAVTRSAIDAQEYTYGIGVTGENNRFIDNRFFTLLSNTRAYEILDAGALGILIDGIDIVVGSTSTDLVYIASGVADGAIEIIPRGTNATRYTNVYTAAGTTKPLVRTRAQLLRNRSPSQSTPTYSFVDDANTGVDSLSADTVNLIAGGLSRVSVSPSAMKYTGATSSSGLEVTYGGIGVGVAASATYAFQSTSTLANSPYLLFYANANDATGTNFLYRKGKASGSVDVNNTIGQHVAQALDAGATPTFRNAAILGSFVDAVGDGYVDGGWLFTLFKNNVGSQKLRVSDSVVVGAAALAIDATSGFLYIPTTPGLPTGTPRAYAGRVPLAVRSDTWKIVGYNGSAWVEL